MPRTSARLPAPAVPERIDGDGVLAARTERLLADCRRWRLPLAVLRIDVLAPEDANGGATALCDEAAHRVRSRLRAGDAVYRVGDQEIAALLVDVGEDALRDVVARLFRGLVEPYRLGDTLVKGARVRIGQAVCPADGQTGVSLVRVAGARRRG